MVKYVRFNILHVFNEDLIDFGYLYKIKLSTSGV